MPFCSGSNEIFQSNVRPYPTLLKSALFIAHAPFCLSFRFLAKFAWCTMELTVDLPRTVHLNFWHIFNIEREVSRLKIVIVNLICSFIPTRARSLLTP